MVEVTKEKKVPLSYNLNNMFSMYSYRYSSFDLLLGLDMGVSQNLESLNETFVESVKNRLLESRRYLESVDVLPPVKRICRNQEPRCTRWAMQGECDSNPDCEYYGSGNG